MTRKAIMIGDLSRMTGTKVPTIRYYEQIGILPTPDRSHGNQRRYTRQDVDRLLFVRRGRELGFSLEDVRRLLELADGRTAGCDEVHAIADRHIAMIEDKIEGLLRVKAELEHMRDHSAHGTVTECHIIEALSGQCAHDEARAAGPSSLA